LSGLKIALIRQKYDAAGGAERFVSRAMRALAVQGVEVTLITRKWESGPSLNIVEVTPRYWGSTWRDWAFSRAVCKHLRGVRYDLVQSHERLACCDVFRAGDGVHREWLAQRGRKMGSLARLAMRCNPHHAYILHAERRMYASPRLRSVICISDMVKQEVKLHYGVPDDKLEIIYLGVDVEEFYPDLRSRYRKPMRDKLGLPPDMLTLLFVGSGFERKGVDTLLRAVAISTTPCSVVVVGRDKNQKKYRTLADQLGIAVRVRFVGAQNDVKPFYAASDALFMPGLYEPFGNANMEAMAMGLPIVTSTKSGAAELLQKGVSGYVFDALDVEGFASAIDALANRHHLATLAAEARRIAERHSLDNMTRQLLELYRRLLRADSPI
jgi:UDP-glucose:(heptosyl)LPS alpha-1,3-glucosyltransferase